MPTHRRSSMLAFLATASLCLTLSACAILGYTPETQFPSDYSTIRVPIFVNKTFAKGLEVPITEAVIREIEKRSRYKVVQREDADTELIGTLVGTAKHVTLEGPLNEVREGELVLAVELTWRDLRSGEFISNPAAKTPWEAPSPLMPPDVLDDAPPPKAVPIRVVRTATFVQELGQSPASAQDKLADDLARQIVNMMERGW